MDEPTTHLDLSSVDALVNALAAFTGTIIFISHDVYFIRALANHVVHVNAGQLTHYGGGYQYYLDKTAALNAREALTAGTPGTAPASPNRIGTPASGTATLDRKAQKRIEAEQRNARSRERKAQQQVVHRLEKQIQELEKRQAEITVELEKPDTYEKGGAAAQLNREMSHNEHELRRLNADWESAATKLTELDA